MGRGSPDPPGFGWRGLSSSCPAWMFAVWCSLVAVVWVVLHVSTGCVRWVDAGAAASGGVDGVASSAGDGRGCWWSATSAVRAARSRWTSTTVGRGAPSPGVPASMKSNAFSGCVRSTGQSLAGWMGWGRDRGKPLAVGGGHDNGGALWASVPFLEALSRSYPVSHCALHLGESSSSPCGRRRRTFVALLLEGVAWGSRKHGGRFVVRVRCLAAAMCAAFYLFYR